MRRVVVTGLGLVTPLADGVEETWSRLLDGQSGAGTITRFDPQNVVTKYACEVPMGDGSDGTFNADDYMEPKERRKVDDFILYGVAAADQAVRDANWMPEDEESRLRTGVMLGSGIGGLQSIEQTTLLIRDKGVRRVSPFFIPGALINLISGQVGIRYGFKGPNHSVVTACSTGAHAIGDAARLIMFGDADVMVAGGAEAAICEIGIAGFNACKALSTKRADDPKAASRPYDEDRDGFVMGEGAGVVVLEELEHAKARGAKIYAEILGYGLSGDAYHITAPSEDGDGGYRAMKMALGHAGIDPSEVDYINAHGTSTMADTIELKAVERLLGDAASKAAMSSTKSATGHLLGAAGAIEAIFSILAVRDQVVPPTINLDNPAVESPIDLVPNVKQERKVDVAMSNSFGFGGTNASLCIGKLR
ncbi:MULTISPECIES: beta-ketoacyl-ACP synthase II [Roseovarius]|jgi:3-oxoacyl-[acyl-carrier-protein] synthase II|uniref:3-oxoacyl-[acyl-carrier-protein] synthase 2 n=1 Tax=Roseovarius nubinhibens TaxID=314263 RepID=A0A348W861_9RHOB|nr:beta-ketoacyl-ACP synthase II [Roseovarius nubinhibens]MAO27647.1 beta-ketoacyl-[acyl-carrier-protein] synthase II [Roseovarius sp.]MBU2998337.1 beta-ketoacyl-ACP synthase II [Roseovarius nubinhibens]HAR50723.1 beta-ketoacyl-[acyl-carrier-protein] synthase II [Roseovarius nubinhibens]|tara:strand:+ start:923 stop:2182 length:1260 start_codon:yes stop_codon:yes gene_type:complete